MNELLQLEADVGILGAGPGGMATAAALARAGLRVVVLDEGARPGGQVFRQAPVGAATDAVGHGPDAVPPSHEHGHELLAAITASGVAVLSGAVVFDVAPGRVWFERAGVPGTLRCRDLVLAPGAYDRLVPFPGWTLPGVVTAGGLQVMVRGFGVKPGRRALVAGSGPLLLPTVTSLLAAGVEVVAALEASSRWRALRAVPAVLGNAVRRRDALWYARQLWRAGVRLRWGWTVFACEGDGVVQRAVIGRVDRTGAPILGSERAIDVDVVGVGFGLVPSVETAGRLGCTLRYDVARGGHCVAVDARQQTSIEHVWAVGEICGIGGAEVAIAEGELAAAAIVASRAGGAVPAGTAAKARAERRGADAMLRAFAPLPGLVRLANDDTIVCRCEDVTLAAARDAAALFGTSLRAIKMGCRAGMGPCQGRICSPMLQALATGGRVMACDAPVAQMPLKPVRAGTMGG